MSFPDVERGYLDTEDNGYLEGPYLAGEYEDVFGMQVNMVITAEEEYGQQAEMMITPQEEYGQQAQMVVTSQEEYGQQAEMLIESAVFEVGQQAEMVVTTQEVYGQQAEMVISEQNEYGMQALMHIIDAELDKGMQANLIITGNTYLRGMEVKADTLRHNLHGVYLEDEYLVGNYLVEQMCAFMGMQVQAVKADVFGMQSTMVIYNTTALRIMWEFPSRGTAALLGLNWTASSQYPGDYDPENVNTDIIEQVYRSAASSSSLVELVCDTGVPQGIPVDTIAILGHNLTTSATVQVQGSNDNFSTTNIVFNMFVESNNMYYISPTFPPAAGQNRYWKFIIQDPTNPSGYVEIGTILFGVSEIFSVHECFINPIVHGKRHFKDSLETEGFTTASNDRALKKFMRLRFEKLNYTRYNYRILDEMLEFARTSLKVLVIPLPEFPSRFAIYGKVAAMPEISSTYIGQDDQYVDIDIEWDESL